MEAFDYINDPLTAGQIATLERLLQGEWSEKARDGFPDCFGQVHR